MICAWLYLRLYLRLCLPSMIPWSADCLSNYTWQLQPCDLESYWSYDCCAILEIILNKILLRNSGELYSKHNLSLTPEVELSSSHPTCPPVSWAWGSAHKTSWAAAPCYCINHDDALGIQLLQGHCGCECRLVWIGLGWWWWFRLGLDQSVVYSCCYKVCLLLLLSQVPISLLKCIFFSTASVRLYKYVLTESCFAW